MMNRLPWIFAAILAVATAPARADDCDFRLQSFYDYERICAAADGCKYLEQLRQSAEQGCDALPASAPKPPPKKPHRPPPVKEAKTPAVKPVVKAEKPASAKPPAKPVVAVKTVRQRKPVFVEAVAPHQTVIISAPVRKKASVALPPAVDPVFQHRGEATAYEQLTARAEQGDALSQFNLGFLFYNGHGGTQDFVRAHMWFNLAASQGLDKAGIGRDTVTRMMVPGQVATAQKMARKWMENHPN